MEKKTVSLRRRQLLQAAAVAGARQIDEVAAGDLGFGERFIEGLLGGGLQAKPRRADPLPQEPSVRATIAAFV